MISTSRSLRGFTLLELLIVVAVIAILASLAIPNLAASRLTSNESSAIATLKTVLNAQATVRQMVSIDVDLDGQGEFATFAELAGAVPLRGTPNLIAPPILSGRMGNVQNSAVNDGGYLFELYLPGPGGAPVLENPAGGIDPAAVSADLCEFFWVCYAWPNELNSSGNRAFVAAYPGGILETPNDIQQYSGIANRPLGDACFTQPNDITSYLSIGGNPGPAQDGGLWIPTN